MINTTRFSSKIIKVDSKIATRYNNDFQSSFTYNFDTITIDSDYSFVYSLTNFVCPYSFYSINRFNQYLDVFETINNIEQSRVIVIPSGNYSVYDYSSELLRLLNIHGTNIVYSIVYIRTQNRYRFSYTTSNNTTAICSFLFASGPNKLESCCEQLGFNSTDDITLLNNGQTLISSNCISMSEISYLQLKTDLSPSLTLSADGLDGVLETIPINCAPYSFIQYNINDISKKWLISEKSISSIDVKLTDNFNRDVNLNGLGYYFTIKLDVIKNDDHGISHTKNARDDIDKPVSDGQTNLEIISNNPDIIKPPIPDTPIDMNDLIDYLNIEQMIKKNKKKSRPNV